MKGATVVVMVECGDKMLKQDEVCWGPMAIRLQVSDMVIPGCVLSHEIPEKTHPLLASQACQAKLGMTKKNGCVTVQSHWMTTTHNDWKFLDKWGLD